MPISYAEQTTLTCPNCGEAFTVEVWTLVDAAERPDLLEALHAGTLDAVTCPHCAYTGPAGAPLLLHHPAHRRVYFAVPPGASEHQWREQAQALLYLLIGSLPEHDRHAYLGDVQVEQDVEGIRRSLARRARRAAAAAAPDQAQQPVVRSEAPPVAAPGASVRPEQVPELLDAVRALVAADDASQFDVIVDEHPQLLTAAVDPLLAELIAVAEAEAEHQVAEALRAVRDELLRRRGGAGPPAAPVSTESAEAAGADQAIPVELSEAAYQALLQATSSAEVYDLVRSYPALLEPWADAELLAREEAALEEGNERLAGTIDDRRAALEALRADLAGETGLLQAVRALLVASTEEALARVLADYPALLTDAAQEMLLEVAAGARAEGDPTLAAYAVECRAMLRTVRAGLAE